MSIPTYAELRQQLNAETDDIPHPTKGENARYGRVAYIEGGSVAVLHGGVYLLASGEDHAESVWALAYHLGLTKYDPGVKAKKISRAEFVRRVTGG